MSSPSSPSKQIHLPPSTSLHPLAQLSVTHPLHLGPSTYIHLRAHLFTSLAPLRIGAHCIVAEKAHVGLPKDAEITEEEQEKEDGVVLEDYVVVESRAIVEGRRVGEGTVVEVGAKVGRGSVVGKYCTIGPLCVVEPYEVIPDHTIIYGYNERRIDRSGTDALRAKMVEQHVEVLKKAETAAWKR